jgi:hypothetical protein
MSTHPAWPGEVESRRLAADLLGGLATAPGEIAAAFLGPLAAYLRRKFPNADPDLCEEAAGEAIVATVTRRNRFDPARLGLTSFLRMAARRDLQNRLAREARFRGIPLGSVAEPEQRGNGFAEEDTPGWDDPRLAAEIAAFDPTESLVLDLIRGGARETAEFVPPLGLSHLPPEEQAAAVKRYKDRVKKRLARAVGGAE